jgi:hypothetical protein
MGHYLMAAKAWFLTMTIAMIIEMAWQKDHSRQEMIAGRIEIALSTQTRDAILEKRTILEYS